MSDTSPAPRSRSWPFQEAEKLIRHLEQAGKSDAVPLFETGYGPSGLPHIGTFGEVARTCWVRQAYTTITGKPTKLLAFSDDMDGLRKVPGNVPNRELLEQHLGKPLTVVPDPFGTHESFGAHNNARLRAFLDRFGFEYEFASATDYYRSGRFDAALLRVLERHDEIVAVIAPTLGDERRATYSPILPIHPVTGQVMQVRIEGFDVAAGTVRWTDPEGVEFVTPVTGGAAKLQWKADWAMRWHALGVDYEMSGKDLIDSVKLSSQICRILGSLPPVNLTYELFLDEEGRKISKTKGNGLSIEEWLTYAPPESLATYMFAAPQRAKRLFFDVIPRAVDDYLSFAGKARASAVAGEEQALQENPVWFVHGGKLSEAGEIPVSFGMLLNLASVANAETPEVLWGFLQRYAPGVTPQSNELLARLVDHAIVYYRDFVATKKSFRVPDARDRVALTDLAVALRDAPAGLEADALQNLVFEVGKRHDYPTLRDWFGCLYEVLLGQKEGPRFGIFIAMYGVGETVALIEKRLAAEPAPAAAIVAD